MLSCWAEHRSGSKTRTLGNRISHIYIQYMYIYIYIYIFVHTIYSIPYISRISLADWLVCLMSWWLLFFDSIRLLIRFDCWLIMWSDVSDWLLMITVICHTKNCQTKNLWANIMKSRREEIRRCTKKVHLLRLIICLTQIPNLKILSLKIGRSNSYHDYDYYIYIYIYIEREREREI